MAWITVIVSSEGLTAKWRGVPEQTVPHLNKYLYFSRPKYVHLLSRHFRLLHTHRTITILTVCHSCLTSQFITITLV